MAAGPVREDSRVPVAAFDFDGTLTFCDSLLPFLRYTVGRRRFWAKSPYLFWYLFWYLLLYRLGRMDRTEAKEAIIRRYLGGRGAKEIQAAALGFAKAVLPTLVNRAALERLRWHQQANHRLLIVSASLEAYLQPWADAIPGVEAVLGTRLHIEDGRVTGRLDGLNCVGPEKLCRVVEHVGDLEGCYLFAYGDSSGDLDLLRAAQEPAYRSFQRRRDKALSYLRLLRALL